MADKHTWRALFEGSFSPPDITPLLDSPPGEVMTWLTRALFEPLQLMIGFVTIWDDGVDLASVERVCGVAMQPLKDNLQRAVMALDKQAHLITDDYWNRHLQGLDAAPDAQAAPVSDGAQQERQILADWQTLRPLCERVLALVRPVHACLADRAADQDDAMEALQMLAMLVRSGQRVLRALDVAAAFAGR